MELLTSKIYGLEGHTHWSIDFGTYRHNYEGFLQKIYVPNVHKEGRMTITQGDHKGLMETLSFLFFLSW